MSTRVPALVNPALLVWAREKAGLRPVEVARKLNVQPAKIGSWESGDSRPSIRQARLLARTYRRPLALFYLADPPVDFKPMLHDYGMLAAQEPSVATAHLIFEIRRAAERRDIAIELLKMAKEEPPRLPEFGPDLRDPDAFAADMRVALGVSLEQQMQFGSSQEALNTWRTATENMGVLVFQSAKVDVAEMRGLSINEKPLPVVLMNGSDSPNGRTFTIMHELVHLLMNQSGICDISDGLGRLPEDRDAEVFCNRVAGAVLVPAGALSSEVDTTRHSASRSP